MTRAYEETYLDDAMNNLGDMFDYAINDCGLDAEEFYTHFIISGAALRMIQLYEQRQQDINMAGAASIASIAHVLGCKVEDLLE